MRARFIGDPVERLKGRFTKPPSVEWFDVPEGQEGKYANNSHFETDGVLPAAPAVDETRPRRARRTAPPE